LPRPRHGGELDDVPLATASEISGGDIEDSTESASFGPDLAHGGQGVEGHPLLVRGEAEESIASSRTTIRVCMTHSSPSEGSARSVAREAEDR
jgi:hypothetical protein